MRLDEGFFARPTLDVACELIGCRLIWGAQHGIIVETEAYVGQDDAASHAARGLTNRTRAMFGPPGRVYVYFIYGMYWCLNFVTEAESYPAAVLIRGLWLETEHGLKTSHLKGPGVLCRELGITGKDYGRDITRERDIAVESTGLHLPIAMTPRIGIRVATDKLWRAVATPEAIRVLKVQGDAAPGRTS
ncbi:DNA-3-methyladenine glycosylase [bacterium]|nr:DNA-3-methyladenine glycosylase [bacterium]